MQQDCGASALPIVTLISYLTGLTMAFVGSVQLEKFNATIYTADLVCLAMVRDGAIDGCHCNGWANWGIICCRVG